MSIAWTLRLRGATGFGFGLWRADYGAWYIWTLAIGPVCIYWPSALSADECSRKLQQRKKEQYA